MREKAKKLANKIDDLNENVESDPAQYQKLSDGSEILYQRQAPIDKTKNVWTKDGVKVEKNKT